MTEKLDRTILNSAMEKFRKEAMELAETAARNGMHTDNGSHLQLSMLESYEMGLSGELPAFLYYHYEEEKRIQSSPEYKEYKRLKAIFEGK